MVTLLLSGCAGQALTEDDLFDREWREGIDANNWAMCKQAYRQVNTPTQSNHTHRRGRTHRPYEIKSDLVANQCMMTLRNYWEKY